MRLNEIVEADWLKHYQGRGVTLHEMQENFNRYCKEGGAFTATDKVITILKYVGYDTIEFHCMNGGDGRDITKAVNLVTNKLSDKYEKAVTYFDNPRISDFIKFSDFPAWVEEVDLGEDMKYQLTIDLRSKLSDS